MKNLITCALTYIYTFVASYFILVAINHNQILDIGISMVISILLCSVPTLINFTFEKSQADWYKTAYEFEKMMRERDKKKRESEEE